MTYTLQRLSQSADGTFGILLDETGQQLCYTAELPWDNNQPDVSCIPAGTYNVIPHDSVAHPHVWEITGVPNRTGILIHDGNIPEVDSLGCIIVGMKLGWLGTQQAVLQSEIALNNLRNKLPSTFTICIIDPISSSKGVFP